MLYKSLEKGKEQLMKKIVKITPSGTECFNLIKAPESSQTNTDMLWDFLSLIFAEEQ